MLEDKNKAATVDFFLSDIQKYKRKKKKLLNYYFFWWTFNSNVNGATFLIKIFKGLKLNVKEKIKKQKKTYFYCEQHAYFVTTSIRAALCCWVVSNHYT